MLVIVKMSSLVFKADATEAAPIDKASPVTASGTKPGVVAKKREEVQHMWNEKSFLSSSSQPQLVGAVRPRLQSMTMPAPHAPHCISLDALQRLVNLSYFALGAILPMQCPHDRNGASFVASAKNGVMIQVMISALESALSSLAFPYGLTTHID